MNENIKLVSGNYQDICKQIKKGSLHAILTNLPKEKYSTLQELSDKGVLKEKGFCTGFQDAKDFRDIIKMRTKNDDFVLVILKDHNQEIISVCENIVSRNFTIIVPEPVVEVKEKNTDMNVNTKLLLDEIIKSCNDKNFTVETNNSFKDKLKVSSKTISRAVKYLKKNNYIAVEKCGQGRKIILNDGSQDSGQDKTRQDRDKALVLRQANDPEPQEQENTRLSDEQIEEDYNNLISIPPEQVIELQEICREHNFEIDHHYLELKIRCYIGYRNYEQIKRVVKYYLEEHTEYSKSTLSQYLNDHCINWPDIKKIKMEVGCTCQV